MKANYILGLDVAKKKVRAALCAPPERFLFEKDLPVRAAGRRELLARLREQVRDPAQLLIVIEATGVLHLNWSAALSKAGYQVAVINPLMAHRLCATLENSIRDNKTDAIDARGLCALGAREGEKLQKYRFVLEAERFALQRLHTARKALRQALTNCKKTYQSLLEVSFPELGQLLQVDGVGIRALLAEASTPEAIARKRLATLEGNWMLRPKAVRLKALAADSIADPELSAASVPALRALLETVAALESRLRALDQEIARHSAQRVDPQSQALLQTIPGFASTTASKVLAYLPGALLHSGSNRKVAARLQAFMGNDPRLRESGQWKGQIKMSKRGVEILRTALFQAAFSASQHDPELKAFYARKRAQGKKHEVALSHLMRILTRRLVAVLRSQQPYKPKELVPLSHAA